MENFDDIRTYQDKDYKEVSERLWNNPEFLHVFSKIPFVHAADDIREQALSFSTVRDLHYQIIPPLLKELIKSTTSEVSYEGFDVLDKNQSYLYLSNHRDIVMDTTLLNWILFQIGYGPCQTAIGDNLLIRPWISDLVRLCKSFIVKRNLGVREQIAASSQLSAYIHHTLHTDKQSIWLAHREGRAKDSNDLTQKSILKMLNLSNNGNILEYLSSLRLIPLCISYEFDPCDYLKAKEMQLKRDHPDFRKSQEDDLLSMQTGIMGYKGRVHYAAGECIGHELLTTIGCMSKNDFFEKLAQMLDYRIHSNYRLYPNNYVAADLSDGTDVFAQYYTSDEKERFSLYLQQQLRKIDLPGKDEPFLRSKMLEMYANPLKNKKKAKCL